MGRRECSLEKWNILDVEEFRISEDHGVVAGMGQGGGASGGVDDWGTYEEDDPGTWEALISPWAIPVRRGPGDHSPTSRWTRVPA